MRKMRASGTAKAFSLVGLFSKAAELGAFAGMSPCEMSFARVTMAKADNGGRAETCRASVARSVGCCEKTVSRAAAKWSKVEWNGTRLCRVVKTLTGFVVLWEVSAFQAMAAAVDAARLAGRRLLLTMKEMAAQFAQAIDLFGKGHGVQSSGHGVPRSQLEPDKREENRAEKARDVSAYLAECQRSLREWS